MIQLLSFDIGIKNMAYCYAIIGDNNDNDNDNNLIIKTIDKIDLNCNKNNIQDIIDNTIEFLDDLMIKLNIEDINDKLIILIECQMTSIMRNIQTCINTYFKLLNKHLNFDIETVYVSPKHKLKIMDKFSDTIIASTKYKQNKMDAIFYTTHLLQTNYRNDAILAIINSNKKKDDLCDAILMCVYYHIQNK